MRCSYKPQANGLWSVWYCLITLTMTAYLFYLGIRRHLLFKEHEWPRGSHAYIYSVISVALQGFALILTPFFIAASCFKVGNLASDGERLGDRTKKVLDVLAGTPLCRKLKSAWQHGPPVAQTIHLSMAFALLMAHTLVETQFFKHYGSSILKIEDVWTTDLEFLYRSQDDKLTQLILENAKDKPIDSDPDTFRQQQYQASSNFHNPDYDSDRSLSTMERYVDPSISSRDVSPNLLPLLSNFRLYGISLLFVNYIVALFVYASVYPSVYWRANKTFSFVFSSHLLLHAVASIFAFIGFQILYRHHFPADGVRPPFVLNEHLLIAVYVASCTILFFASSVVYGYGYNKFCLLLLTAAAGGRGRLLRLRGPKTYPVCCEGYSPHIAAILMLILMVAAKAPLLYDQMILYQKYFRPITLVCIIVDVAYLFAWILLWLALTLKREWAFKVRYSNSEIGALLGMQTEEGRVVTDNTLMVMCGEHYFATDDESKRAAVLQLAEKCGLGQHEEEVYWLKPSHTTTGGGNADGQKSTGSPEMNNLLGGSNNAGGGGQRQYQQQHLLHHTHQPPHTKAATIGVSGGNYYKRYGVGRNGGGATETPTLGYSKVSFSDGEDTTPYAQKQQQQQQQRFAQTRASGSYVRFSDDQSAAGLNYDDHATQDIVSTFGTLPRQDYPRRRIIHDNEADFFAQPSKQQQPTHVQTLASMGALKRTPSPVCPPFAQSEAGDPVAPGVVTYASVHKRSGSPSFRTAEYGRIIQQQPQSHAVVPGIGDTQTDSQNVSRVSSYANIPTSSKQNWDSLSKVDATRPPTGRPTPYSGNGHQQPPQQYHHHQHHYSVAGSTSGSPQPYGTLPHPTSISGVPPGNGGTPNNQTRRNQVGCKPVAGPETLALLPRASPKHSPNLEPEGYHNGQIRKLTSFSNSSSASAGVGGGESTDTTPTQQTYGGLLAPSGSGTNPTALTASASSSSREMTPLSNASGSLNRPPSASKAGISLHQQPPTGANWHSNPVYGAPGSVNRSYTPQNSNYGTVTPTTAASSAGPAGSNHIGDHSHQHPYDAGGGLGAVYYNGGLRPGSRPLPTGAAADGLGASSASVGGGRALLGFESHDRNDSTNFSLTSGNESENHHFVTSIV